MRLGYHPPEPTRFEQIVIENWNKDPIAVWTAVSDRVTEIAKARGQNVEEYLKWAQGMIAGIAERRLSPFAVPYEIDRYIRLHARDLI